MAHSRPRRIIKLTEKASSIASALFPSGPVAQSHRTCEKKEKTSDIRWKLGLNKSQFGLTAPAAPQCPNQKDRQLSAATRSRSTSNMGSDVNIATSNEDQRIVNDRQKHHRVYSAAIDEDGVPSTRFLRSLERQMEKLAYEAMHNKEVFDFDFVKNCEKKTKKVPKLVITWEDETPRTAMSTDGYVLAMYIPKAVCEKGQEAICAHLYEFAKKLPPSMHKTQKTKDKPKVYVKGPGLITGEHRICRGWHAIGHNKPQEFGPCADYLHSTCNFNETCQFAANMSLLSHRVNVLMRTLDPTHYHDAEELKKRLSKMYPGYGAIAHLDKLVYDGREVLWNVLSDLHTDRQDPVFGWAILCTFGDFKGGHIYLPNLGLRMRMQPGDIVFIKGRVLRHKVEEWTGGQRICVPHFTHTSVWKMVKELGDRLGANVDTEGDD